jgi:hypothetical protein
MTTYVVPTPTLIVGERETHIFTKPLLTTLLVKICSNVWLSHSTCQLFLLQHSSEFSVKKGIQVNFLSCVVYVLYKIVYGENCNIFHAIDFHCLDNKIRFR